MHSTVNSDESAASGRSAHIALHTDYPSGRRKKQISSSKNAQTQHETHLSFNNGHSSAHGLTTPLNPHVANPERHVNVRMVDRPDNIPKDSEGTEQKDKEIDTQDIDSLPRYRSRIDDKEIGVKPRLWCLRCRKKREYLERNLAEPTRRLFERAKRSKECGKPDEAVAGVSTVSHRESISRRGTPRKPRRDRKQDATVEVTEDEYAFERARRRQKRRERRKRDKEDERRKEIRRERREKRKREEREERILADARLALRDDARPVIAEEDRVSRKPPPAADPTKSCCYLCAQNTLAITAAAAVVALKPQQSDKCVQVSAHKLHAETLDKSCSVTLLVRAVQPPVKVKMREIGTLCPGAMREETKPRTKRRRFSVFSGLTRTKCPAGRHAACETDKSARRDNAEKHREPRSEKCCREKKND